MVTNAGGGYSRRQQIALTRWREDVTTDAWGSFCYVRDLDTGDVWSATLPADRPGTRGVRSDLRARSRGVAARGRRHRDPHGDRRVPGRRCGAAPRVRDQSQHRHRAASISPATPRSCSRRRRRPGPSGVQQSVRRDPQRPRARCADLRARRPRVGHAASVPGARAQRTRPHGRRRRSTKPIAPASSAAAARWSGRSRSRARHALSNTTGPVLDPIVSLRQSVRLPPGATARFAFTTGYAESEEARAAA